MVCKESQESVHEIMVFKLKLRLCGRFAVNARWKKELRARIAEKTAPEKCLG